MNSEIILLCLAVIALVFIDLKQNIKLKDIYKQCYISLPFNETAQNYTMQNEKLLEIMKNCVQQKTLVIDNEKQKNPEKKTKEILLNQLRAYVWTFSAIYIVFFATKKELKKPME